MKEIPTVWLTSIQLFADNHEDSGQCKKQQKEQDHNDSHQTIHGGIRQAIDGGITWCLKVKMKKEYCTKVTMNNIKHKTQSCHQSLHIWL